MYQNIFSLIPLFSYISEDPYLSQRADTKKFLDDYLEMNKIIRIDLLQRMLLKYVSDKLQSTYETKYVIFWRIRASDFKLQNRHEKAGECKTLYSMLADGFKGKYLSFRRQDRRPFRCTFRGEGACDCGGPMRDLISNVCEELMQDAVPILTPTQNNLAKIEPFTDCVKLNPSLTQNFWLKRLVFFGYFLGWSLRTMGGLGLDLPPCFW